VFIIELADVRVIEFRASQRAKDSQASLVERHPSSLCGPWKARQMVRTTTITATQGAIS
jgi:hypothetical protein